MSKLVVPVILRMRSLSHRRSTAWVLPMTDGRVSRSGNCSKPQKAVRAGRFRLVVDRLDHFVTGGYAGVLDIECFAQEASMAKYTVRLVDHATWSTHDQFGIQKA